MGDMGHGNQKGSRMKIAIVAPLAEAVPPPLYGGTERVVAVLAEELVKHGHDVTLFAAGDSQTSARLVACTDRSLRLNPDGLLPCVSTVAELAEVYARADEFDVIHSHVDWLAFPFARLSDVPTISTIHGRLDLPVIHNTFARFPEQPLVSISDAQRKFVPECNWLGTVHNGIALDHFRFRPDPGQYLVFLGRITPEKRPDRAIEVAAKAGRRLIIAAKVDPADQEYYDETIAPLIRRSPWVEYVGEVGEKEKADVLGQAYAYLFPIDWPEPFGLTMVEAMATGTPVIAWRGGSVEEVVKDGVSGFICDSIPAMVAAVGRVSELKREDCLAQAQRFSPEAMTQKYEQMYHTLVHGRQPYELEHGVGLSDLEVAPTPPKKLRLLGRRERVA